MNELTGMVPGATVREQARTLAGILAEQGVASARLVEGTLAQDTGGGAEDGARVLTTRRTDLPGEIEAAAAKGGNTRLVCEALELTIEVGGAGLRWRTRRTETAALFVSER